MKIIIVEMELLTTKNKEFRRIACTIIEESGEILVLLRYPYAAGLRDYFVFKSCDEFDRFLHERKPKDSILLFRSFRTIKDGVVTEKFIDDVLPEMKGANSVDWVAMFPVPNDTRWTYENTKEELTEALTAGLGRHVRIFDEPDWFDEDLVIHAYVPDTDGHVRPGAY